MLGVPGVLVILPAPNVPEQMNPTLFVLEVHLPAITFGELGVASIVQEGLDHLNVPQFSSPVCIVVRNIDWARQVAPDRLYEGIMSHAATRHAAPLCSHQCRPVRRRRSL